MFFSVMSKGLNDAGRGLNFAVVNPKTKDVIRLARFDTYGTGKKESNTTEFVMRVFIMHVRRKPTLLNCVNIFYS